MYIRLFSRYLISAPETYTSMSRYLFYCYIERVLSNFHSNSVLIDLDIDSQTDGANAVMSGLDSESESDVPDGVEPEDEPTETIYVHSPEEEFGAVSENTFFFFVVF